MLYENLLKPLGFQMSYSHNNGIYDDISDFHTRLTDSNIDAPMYYSAVMCDQEPLSHHALTKLWQPESFLKIKRESHDTGFVLRHDALSDGYYVRGDQYFLPNLQLLATSEHSKEKTHFLKYLDNTYDWYYFYHGFSSLSWFKSIPYQPPITKYSKLFISFNHLFTEKRSYRLSLIAKIREHELSDRFFTSLNQHHTKQQIKQELCDSQSLLNATNKKLIHKHLWVGNTTELTIDTNNINGTLSATDSLPTLTKGLFHLVTETVFYDEKLHLTEKIFKPIVAMRPFLLVAAPGNLEYLKSYGFRTFDRWIDESYDSESDPDIRLDKIMTQILNLCQKPQWQIDQMYSEMRSTLEHNFYHFYTDFKQIIVTEMVDNFRRCVIKHNAGRYAGMQNFIDHTHMDWQQIKRRLSM